MITVTTPSPLPGTLKVKGSKLDHQSFNTIRAGAQVLEIISPDGPAASKALISGIQKKLNQWCSHAGNHETVKITGIYDSATQSAVFAFQSEVIGKPDSQRRYGPKTDAALNAFLEKNKNIPAKGVEPLSPFQDNAGFKKYCECRDNKCSFQKGESGEAIAIMQRTLKVWADKKRDHALSVSGKFGSDTKAAICLFQKTFGYEVTGVVDSQTLLKIESIAITIAKNERRLTRS